MKQRNPNKTFRKIVQFPFQGMVVEDSLVDEFLRNGGDPESLFFNSNSLIKSNTSTRTALVALGRPPLDPSRNNVFAKEFFYKNVLHSFMYLFGRHRAQTLWKDSWYLLRCDIQVPEPMGYLLKIKGFSCQSGYFYSEVLNGCDNLGILALDLENLKKKLLSGNLIENVAKAVGDLHNSGVSHGDLKWSNIMIHERYDRPWFVDLDSAKRFRGAIGPKAIARDLSRFVLNGLKVGIDKSTIENFLDAYVSHRKLTRESIDSSMNKMLRHLKKKKNKVSPLILNTIF